MRKINPEFSEYAVYHGAIKESLEDGKAYSKWWWLRSPGYSSGMAAVVLIDGSVYNDGLNVINVSFTVRPTLWIKFK